MVETTHTLNCAEHCKVGLVYVDQYIKQSRLVFTIRNHNFCWKGAFEIPPLKVLDFKCFLISKGHISDPHCFKF